MCKIQKFLRNPLPPFQNVPIYGRVLALYMRVRVNLSPICGLTFVKSLKVIC